MTPSRRRRLEVEKMSKIDKLLGVGEANPEVILQEGAAEKTYQECADGDRVEISY